jgi:hypothetical protein
LSVRRWNQAAAAKNLEARTAYDIGNIDLPAPHECFSEIRIYLQRTTDKGRTRNGVHVLSRREENGDTLINAGPTIFREPCSACIQFTSGAQLKFGIALRFDGTKTTLLEYNFHLRLPDSSGLRFVRIDLNAPTGDYDPLHVPRSHMHPGFENIHLPFPVMQPLEILDRIVHVIEPHFTH